LAYGGANGYIGVSIVDVDNFETLRVRLAESDYLTIWSNKSKILDKFEEIKIGDVVDATVKFLYHHKVVDPKTNSGSDDGLSAICKSVNIVKNGTETNCNF
jgi:hypothetical protein